MYLVMIYVLSFIGINKVTSPSIVLNFECPIEISTRILFLVTKTQTKIPCYTLFGDFQSKKIKISSKILEHNSFDVFWRCSCWDQWTFSGKAELDFKSRIFLGILQIKRVSPHSKPAGFGWHLWLGSKKTSFLLIFLKSLQWRHWKSAGKSADSKASLSLS